jgi:RNA polymerase sigma factor (sigma-70 family)
MSSSAEVATAGEGSSLPPSLSEAQLSVFWEGIVANGDDARRMAVRFVGRQSVDDVVNTAAILFAESLQRPKKPRAFPATDDDFRRQFLVIVRNHAIDCVRDSNAAERPVHSHWAEEPEPVVGGRKVADRALDRVFARNGDGKYDAPAPAERRAKDDAGELDQILRCHLPDLSRMQREIIVETFFEKRKRAEVARRLGISVKTYDNHLQAAFRSLRQLLAKDADEFTNVDRSVWYDLIEALRERYEAARLRMPSGKRGNGSTTDGDCGKIAGAGAA